MEFINKEHELFWKEKNLLLQKYGTTDSYYRALVYTLGICETTRNNFNKIFDIEKGEINIDSINDPYQTSTSAKVTRMAFSLFNGCNYDSEINIEKGQISSNYNVSDIFCCSYAPYFFEAVKIKYPEYTISQEEQQKYKALTYMRVGNIEQLDYYIDEKIENKKDKNMVSLYMRTNKVDEDMINADIYFQRDKLEKYCKKNNIVNRVYYIDVRKNGVSEDREALDKLIEDIKAGKIKQIVVTNISRLFRNPSKITSLLENNYMKNIDIITLDGGCINRKSYIEIIKKLGFEELARDIKRKQIKDRKDKSR